MISMVGEYLLAQKMREEQHITQSLAVQALEPMLSLDAEQLYLLASNSASQYGGRVMITDEYGVCVADSESELNGCRLALLEVSEALINGEGKNAFYGQKVDRWLGGLSSLGGDGTLFALYAEQIQTAGRAVGALVFTAPSQDVYENLQNIQRQITVYLVLVAVAVLILSFFVSRSLTQPINDLSQGIARMAQGDLSARVEVRGKNEFSQLAEAFNMMCERLESLDNTRNQFVSNASHELKTPLSTMKILLETLLYQEQYDPGMQHEFLSDINKEIDRLNDIVNDLLTLVHFDGGKMEIRPVKLSMENLLKTTIHRLEPLAKEKQIDVSLSIVDSIDTMGDQMKLEQVFYNLVGNAIKYTQPGGRVKVELLRQSRMAVVMISDNGIGIPKSDMKYVFDRFYRVDKARARQTGGTGLGLAIVKQIVMLHEGSIAVASEEDKGTTFTVELPIINL